MSKAPAGPARFLKPRYLIAALVPALIVVFAITGFVWAQTGVTVVVDGESRYIDTQAEDVAGLLAEAGVSYTDTDVVSPAPDTSLEDGMSVVVRHAVPVTLRMSGEELDLDVVGATVADALIAAGVDPDESLVVEPGLSAPLEEGMTITTNSVFVRVVEESEDIPYETVTKNDPQRTSGSREIVTQGVPGTVLRVFRVVVTDGQESDPELVAERVVSDPVDEVVAVGTKRQSVQVASRAASAGRTAQAPAEGTKLAVSATAYAPGVDGVGTRTATGARAGYGIIAVDPRVIPLGTRLYIPGYGYGIAADTGGAIKGNKIDVCYDTRAEALAWGRRSITIILLP